MKLSQAHKHLEIGLGSLESPIQSEGVPYEIGEPNLASESRETP